MRPGLDAADTLEEHSAASRLRGEEALFYVEFHKLTETRTWLRQAVAPTR